MSGPSPIIAGRELDTLIAEKVMGLDRPVGGYIHDGLLSLIPLPFYSTDITAAWKVIEQFGSCRIELIHWGDSDTWQVNIGGAPGRETYRMPQADWADTAPLAICRAALAAVDSLP